VKYPQHTAAMLTPKPPSDATSSVAPPVAPAYLTGPLPDLAAWSRYFLDAEIPVLTSTAMALERLRAREDEVDAHMLGEVIQADPLMTVKLMAHVASKRRAGSGTETESVTASLLLMGVAPFFRDFGPQPAIKDRLRQLPLALEGLRNLMQRSKRAAHFALGFAVHRGDMDASVIHTAAFLYDFAEMLMWCHAPTLQLRIALAQQADPALRTAAIQRSVLNIEIDDLRQNLMSHWHLPELLVRICDSRHADQAIVRNVVLAVRLARHTMHGWDNAAVPDDVNDIAQLLNASPRAALAFLHKIEQTG